MISIEKTIFGHTFSAVLDEETVDIARDGAWVGTGVWVDGKITDCDAVLGANEEEIYKALELAIALRYLSQSGGVGG